MTPQQKTFGQWVAGLVLGLPTLAGILFFAINAVFATDTDVRAQGHDIDAVKQEQITIHHALVELKRIGCVGLSEEQKKLVEGGCTP